MWRNKVLQSGLPIVLLLTLLLYAFAGAGIFYAVEKPAEDTRNENALYNAEIKKAQAVEKLLSLLETCNSSREACKNATVRIVANLNVDPTEHMWTFWSAFYYSTTIYTTIGYGNIYCITTAGRCLTMIYALIGVPFTLLVLKTICDSLQTAFQAIFRACCLQCCKRDHTEQTITLYFGLPCVAVFILLGAMFISFSNGWDYFTSFYFLFITLTTIVSGTVTPTYAIALGDKTSIPVKYIFFTFFLNIIGLCLVAAIVGELQNLFERYWAKLLHKMNLNSDVHVKHDEHPTE